MKCCPRRLAGGQLKLADDVAKRQAGRREPTLIVPASASRCRAAAVPSLAASFNAAMKLSGPRLAGAGEA